MNSKEIIENRINIIRKIHSVSFWLLMAFAVIGSAFKIDGAYFSIALIGALVVGIACFGYTLYLQDIVQKSEDNS